MLQMPDTIPAQVPANWTLYFTVADCDGSVKRAESLGGKVVVPAMEVPNTGRFAVLSDPQGGVFGILQQPSR
jgi:predicted enzyme related to lactoylglutathione lyase